jgi:hypothetical protein
MTYDLLNVIVDTRRSVISVEMRSGFYYKETETKALGDILPDCLFILVESLMICLYLCSLYSLGV